MRKWDVKVKGRGMCRKHKRTKAQRRKYGTDRMGRGCF